MEEENNKKITIADVAKLAGVSKGTVDRVLHDRGGVSRKSMEKIRQVIDELGYEPNVYASMLAMRKEHVIACILPDSIKDDYWYLVREGFEKGGENIASMNIRTRIFLYDQYSPESFRKAGTQLLESNPSGVVLPPFFKNDTYTLANALSLRGIPYVYVDSKLEDDGHFAYYGMPMYKSGYLCARLLTLRVPQKQLKGVLVVRIIRDKMRQSDPTLNRRSGFLDYMAEHYPSSDIHNLFIDPQAPKDTERQLNTFFKAHPGIHHIVMFNSRVHLLSDYLSRNPDPDRVVVGFDNLEKNISALSSGLINILICQHTDLQSYNAVMALSDYIIKHKRPERKDNFMHMDILTSLNIDNY